MSKTSNFSKCVFVASKIFIFFSLRKGWPHSEFIPSGNSISSFIIFSTVPDSTVTFTRIFLANGITINTELWFSIVSWPWRWIPLLSISKVNEMLMSLSSGSGTTSSESFLKIWIFIKINLLFNCGQTSSTVWLSSLFVTNSSIMVSSVIGSINIGIVFIVTLCVSFTHTIWGVGAVSVLSCCVSSHLDSLTDEIIVGKFLIDSIEHTLMLGFLIINLISHHYKVFVVFEHTISVSSMIFN